MNNLMIDLETLGIGPKSVVTQIGACFFDWNGEIGEKILINVDIQSNLDFGRTVSGSTIRWWFQQPEQTFLDDSKGMFDVADAVDLLKGWILENVKDVNDLKVWSHATFDIPILDSLFKDTGIKSPFYFRNMRDIRTLVDLATSYGESLPDVKSQKTHDALDDCLHQVEYCVILRNRLLGVDY